MATFSGVENGKAEQFMQGPCGTLSAAGKDSGLTQPGCYKPASPAMPPACGLTVLVLGLSAQSLCPATKGEGTFIVPRVCWGVGRDAR